MGRYNDLYKEHYKRDSTTFPNPFNKLIKLNTPYRLKILTDPREVRSPYGRKIALVEVEYEGKDYTLYLSQVDLFNRMAVVEKAEIKRTGNNDLSLVGRTVVLKQLSPRRYSIELEPQHQY
jgi:hypothetical protein